MNKLPNYKRALVAFLFAMSLLAPMLAYSTAPASQLAQHSTPVMAVYTCWKCGGS